MTGPTKGSMAGSMTGPTSALRSLARLASFVALVLAQAFCANAGSASSGSGKPSSPAPSFEADVTITSGPGASATSFALRGRELTVVLPTADDGAAAGVYRLRLDARDALPVSLTRLPERASGPPPVAGMPAATFSVRDRGKTRTLAAALPSSDAQVGKALAELARCEQAARTHPVATLALAVDPPSKGKVGQPRTVIVRATVTGQRGAEIELDASALVLETTAEPKPATPGVTPLPPEWDVVSQSQKKPTPKVIRTGSTIKLPVVAVEEESGPRYMRAALQGQVLVRLPDGKRELSLHLSSKPVRGGAVNP